MFKKNGTTMLAWSKSWGRSPGAEQSQPHNTTASFTLTNTHSHSSARGAQNQGLQFGNPHGSFTKESQRTHWPWVCRSHTLPQGPPACYHRRAHCKLHQASGHWEGSFLPYLKLTSQSPPHCNCWSFWTLYNKHKGKDLTSLSLLILKALSHIFN